MSGTRRVGAVAAALVIGVVLALVAPAFACEPGASVQLSRDQAAPATVVTATVSGFRVGASFGPVEVAWSKPAGADPVPVTSGAAPSFQFPFSFPSAAPGVYALVASQRQMVDGAVTARAVRMFEVLGADVVAPDPPGDSAPPVHPVASAGYRMVAADGGLFAFGDAGFFGSMGGRPLNRPIVGMASTPSGDGYWEVASDGGIFAFGDAGFFGSMGGRPLARPIVGMASTPSGHGYWLVASDGGIFAFGDARFLGSTGGRALSGPIVGMDRTTSGAGYWLVGSDGGVFAFGDAEFLGSVSGLQQNRAITGIARSPRGGYWLVDSASFVFPFGEFWAADEPFDRSVITHPIVGSRPTGEGRGHWLAATDGGVFAAFGAPFLGSMGGVPLAHPVVGITATRG